MNILDFEKWIINEGIDVKVSSDDNETKDDITIDNTTYSVDDDGKVTQNDNKEIDDESLKDDVKDASDDINILKKTERNVEIRRITGGDKRHIKDDINNLIKQGILRKDINLFEPNNFNQLYFYIPINYDNINKKDVINIYNSINRGVGKGEYFLPLMYHDVYKKQPYVEIGDNFIKTNDKEEINLELKGSNINLKFDSTCKDILNDNTKNYDERLKEAIVSSFLKYAIKESSKRKNLYMCIFVVEDINPDRKTPKGMVFINISNIGGTKDENIHNLDIFEPLKDIITISYSNNVRDGYDFKYNAKCDDNGKIEIECILDQKYNIQESKSQILSRDNFVNEIYTK